MTGAHPAGHDRSLDGVRAIAAYAVIGTHVGFETAFGAIQLAGEQVHLRTGDVGVFPDDVDAVHLYAEISVSKRVDHRVPPWCVRGAGSNRPSIEIQGYTAR